MSGPLGFPIGSPITPVPNPLEPARPCPPEYLAGCVQRMNDSGEKLTNLVNKAIGYCGDCQNKSEESLNVLVQKLVDYLVQKQLKSEERLQTLIDKLLQYHINNLAPLYQKTLEAEDKYGKIDQVLEPMIPGGTYTQETKPEEPMATGTYTPSQNPIAKEMAKEWMGNGTYKPSPKHPEQPSATYTETPKPSRSTFKSNECCTEINVNVQQSQLSEVDCLKYLCQGVLWFRSRPWWFTFWAWLDELLRAFPDSDQMPDDATKAKELPKPKPVDIIQVDESESEAEDDTSPGVPYIPTVMKSVGVETDIGEF